MTALAAVGLVVAIYNTHTGPVADVHATEPGDVNLMAAIGKSGWLAVGAVSALTLLSRDPNIAILGGLAVIAEEIVYRHAHMSDPGTGKVAPMTPAAYAPAGATTPLFAG